MTIHTKICDLLGVEHPVLLAGMGGVSYAEVCAAVSAAGGFGSLGMAGVSPRGIADQMARVRDLTDKPFGVDLLTAQPESLTASVDVIIKGGARAFIAGLGVPVAIVEELKAAGVIVMCMAGNVRHAVKAAEAGCDVIIAQGTEGGGHTGSVASVALWPQVVDAVDIPVIAAGGLFDGRGLVAALSFGCAGVWLGTRFIASEEAHAGQPYKDAIVAMSESDTMISKVFTGKTLRAIVNDSNRDFDNRDAKPFAAQVAESVQLNRLGPIAGVVDNVDPATQCLAAGQGGGGIHNILPAGEIVHQIVAEAEAVLGRMPRAA
ncbi:NAD(P)H-dependent flavin oxidoreductase [Polymorphobacter fuscus]|uniref:Nitronate monooxygenase n=1 Tax=Sandarakinorhabdus fusca TaxID=1439888 RepID=A0A7C9GQZ9_9SPHN|nr:nitronate monooxygenase [Polymorphobacter fuscus]KAB7647511.1 nitronate monooxygenase [Polymorphobacter fuscus]MQT16771.1 nitronate monooxygenase [Polymorphobacter fuscus]NJC09241.1 enoyl-[acyl-carrier protein] reductase II [Polymorphobacter fuscus]